MAELERDFEEKLRASVLDEAEAALYGERDNLTFQFVDKVHGRLERYGDRLDYQVEPLIDSFELIETRRTDRGVFARFGWTNEAFLYMEFGTPEHRIEGNPILSFVWEDRHDPPDWVAQEYEREGDGYRVFLPEVEVAGVEKIRQVRNALRWFRGVMR